MPTFREQSARDKRIEIVRWLLLVPAAVLASIAVQTIVAGILFAADRVSSAPLNTTSMGFWLRTIPYYALPACALVVAAGWLAPRRPLTLAALFTLVAGALSLLKHVVGQLLMGNRVGHINYAHSGLEVAGMLAGLFCVCWLLVHRRAWVEP